MRIHALISLVALAIPICTWDDKAVHQPMQDIKTEPIFHRLPGKVVGVVVADVQSAANKENRRIQNDAVGFFWGADSFRLVYVPVSSSSDFSQSLTLAVGESKSERKRFHAVELLRQSLLKDRRLNEDYNLVEIEVNSGAGSPADVDTFVATQMESIEGTKRFSRRLRPTIIELKKEIPTRWRAPEIQTTFARVQKEFFSDRAPKGKRQESDDLSVTWLPEKESVQVIFRHILTVSEYSEGVGIEKIDPKGHRLRDTAVGRGYGTTVGIEARQVYLISKEGEIRSEPLEIKAIKSMVPPPSTQFPMLRQPRP